MDAREANTLGDGTPYFAVPFRKCPGREAAVGAGGGGSFGSLSSSLRLD